MQYILDHIGLSASSLEPVHGGDINQSYCLHTNDAKYFLKVNDAGRYPGMFEKEAEGLKALQDTSSTRVPKVIRSAITDRNQYLLLEWLEKGRPKPGCWEDFGKELARMHKQPQPYFGWIKDNYIGSLPQYNQQEDTWADFYANQRIIPFTKKLFDNNSFSKRELVSAEQINKRIEQSFPSEPPSLLHGDLWSGNYLVTADGTIAIYDPAVYFGHREMDIGMTRLFGGFDERFYQSYQEEYPLEKDWEKRLPLTQLYPLLVHAVLFGGHYIANAREILHNFS